MHFHPDCDDQDIDRELAVWEQQQRGNWRVRSNRIKTTGTGAGV